LHDILAIDIENKESIPSVIINEVNKVVNNLTPRHKEAFALIFGIGGICDIKVKRQITCRECNKEYEAIIDYTLNSNFSQCECGNENQVNMVFNQTDAAEIMNVTKQRIYSIVKKISSKLKSNISPLLNKHNIIL
jgi:hypothetical protein